MKPNTHSKYCILTIVSLIFVSTLAITGCDRVVAPFGDLYFHVLNTPRGDAILITLPTGRNILVDGGPAEYAEELRSYLHKFDIHAIDILILTNTLPERFGAIKKLYPSVPINEVYINGQPTPGKKFSEFIESLESNNITVRTARTETLIPLKVAEIIVFNPLAFTQDPKDNSLVFKLIYKRTSFLVTSDVGPKAQADILKYFGNPGYLRSNLVVIPAHGGKIGTSFLELLVGNVKVVSSGGESPLKETAEILDSKTYRTDKEGNLIFSSGGNTVKKIKASDILETENENLPMKLITKAKKQVKSYLNK